MTKRRWILATSSVLFAILALAIVLSPRPVFRAAAVVPTTGLGLQTLVELAGTTSAEGLDEADFLYEQVFGAPETRRLKEIDAWHIKDADWYRPSAAVTPPYSDFWFPEGDGGTNGPDTMGEAPTHALELYDRAFYPDGAKALPWEKTNHSDSTKAWYGHCNGFSAAAARHINPGGPHAKPVFRPRGCTGVACVEFTPAAVRALLAEVYMSARAYLLAGSRCDTAQFFLRGEPQNRADPSRLSACDDPDPAGFHLALTHWLGRQHQVLIMDTHRNAEVWNYPAYDYRYRYIGPHLSPAEAVTMIGSERYKTYAFNPDAVSFLVVELEVTYAKALNRSVVDPKAVLPPTRATMKLRYLLELTADDQILGGEWLGDPTSSSPGSRDDHPDFLWVAFEPDQANGSRAMGNPYVDPAEVLSLWTEMTDTKPSGLSPKVPLPWGKSPDFEARLNGLDSGVAFLTDPIMLQLFWTSTALSPNTGTLPPINVPITLTLNGSEKGITVIDRMTGKYGLASRRGWNTVEVHIPGKSGAKFNFLAM